MGPFELKVENPKQQHHNYYTIKFSNKDHSESKKHSAILFARLTFSVLNTALYNISLLSPFLIVSSGVWLAELYSLYTAFLHEQSYFLYQGYLMSHIYTWIRFSHIFWLHARHSESVFKSRQYNMFVDNSKGSKNDTILM